MTTSELNTSAPEKDLLNSRYIVVSIGHGIFLVNSGKVVEMMEKPAINKIPMMPDYILGAANVRGSVIPVYDARVRLGRISFEKEMDDLIKMLKQREQDHRNWLNELYLCVKEERQFTLTTDPHECKFGKWYDNFKNDDMEISKILREFDEPHKQIHALAHRVEDLIKENKRDQAAELIENTGKYTLGRMIDIFGKIYTALKVHDKRILMVLEHRGRKTGMMIDSADNVIKVEDNDISVNNAGSGAEHKFVKLQDGTMGEIIGPSDIFV